MEEVCKSQNWVKDKLRSTTSPWNEKRETTSTLLSGQTLLQVNVQHKSAVYGEGSICIQDVCLNRLGLDFIGCFLLVFAWFLVKK